LKSPNGSVIALNGPWGSGKSSAVNLVRYHLADAVEDKALVLIDFTCWWFRGEDALALAFFRELYAGLAPSLGDKIKKALPKLGARLLRAGAVFGGAADAMGAGGLGTAAGGAMEWLSGLIQQEESVEKLHAELSKVLAEQNKRFLIVIDDIDRLSPDEALLIFRLVKSVGRLPNVLYLLVYDRQLAEKIVSERYPSEGPHYLEKIVQAAFEIPEPPSRDVQQHLLELIGWICGQPADDQIVRFMNIFYDAIAPAMRTPRDVARFTNLLGVTWPAVTGEVDVADFLALEVFRLLHPTIHRAIRQNKELMCRGAQGNGGDRDSEARRYREMLFGAPQAPEDERLERVLMRLFPALESAWGNISYGDGSGRQWALERRVCSNTHFDSYFRFAVGDDVLPRAELDDFVKHAADENYVKAKLRHALTVRRKAGGTKAAVLLDELKINADRIDDSQVLPLLSALFGVADEINVDADRVRGFGIGDNALRLHWLLRALIFERFSLADRSAALVISCKAAALGWLANLSQSAWRDFHPNDGTSPEPPEKCLTTEADAGRLREMLLPRIEAAAADGTLGRHNDLAFLLYLWRELVGDDGAAARAWVEKLYATDEGAKQLAIAFTNYGWTQGMGSTGLGDLVARRTTRVSMTALRDFVDIDVFRKRIEEVAATSTFAEVADFLKAWCLADRGEEE
jgi:predicted KAP-like P-loop ATPase